MESVAEDFNLHPTPCSTHTKFARFQDDFGAQKCTVCQKIPEMGILYQCVPEVTGPYADAELLDLEDEMRKYNVGQRLAGTSADSISTMMSDLTRYNSAGAPKPESMSLEEFKLFHAAKARSRRSTMSTCNFKICQDCLPAYRGRAWPLPDDRVDGIPIPISRRGIGAQTRSDVPRADTPHPDLSLMIPSMNFHPEFRFYQQIPPHLRGERRAPSVVSATSHTMEDDYFEGLSMDKLDSVVHHNTGIMINPYDPYPGQDDGHDAFGAFPSGLQHELNAPTAVDLQEPELLPPRRLRRTSLTPPPSPPLQDLMTLRDTSIGSSRTVSSRTRGQFFDESTIKAMQELERKMDAVMDLDEDSIEKRAGRRLGHGRFFIE